jgi:hypothetical protein
MNIFNIFRKPKVEKSIESTLFPKEVNRLWLAGYMKDRKYKMKYFVKDEYQRYSVGQVVHLFTKNNMRAFYKIINIEVTGYDRAMWDDGKKYDLTLDHTKRVYKKNRRYKQ